MEKRTASQLRNFALVGLVGVVLVLGARSFLRKDAPKLESSSDPVDPLPQSPPSAQVEQDASHYGTREAIADLTEDDYIHKAFVAVGPGDVTVWKDRASTFRTAAGISLCDRCLTTDFVATRGQVAWVELLETNLPGFDSSVRAFSITSGWNVRDAEALTWGDRATSLSHGSAIATDGTAVYVVEGKDDDAGVGYGQTVVRVDLAKSKKTMLAKMPAAIRNLVFASGELFVTWSPVSATPAWRVQAISTKNGAVRDVVAWPFPLPDEAASSTDLYFVYRDEFERTSRSHLASVALAGGAITSIYDTAPNELIGCFAADDGGLYVVRFIGHWVLTRFAKGAPPQDLARFDAMPRALAPRKADIAVAFLDELKLVPK